MNARRAALQTLEEVIREQRSLNTLLTAYKTQLPPADRALYQMLVYSTLRQYRALSYLRNRMLTKPLPEKLHSIGTILNLGINQLLNMNLGDHGVINESVKLAAYCAQPQSKGLVNAILRRVQREREKQQQIFSAAVEHNLPPWLRNIYPNQRTRIARINSAAPPLTLRLHQNHDRDIWVNTYSEPAFVNPLHPQAITLLRGEAVDNIPGFRAGIVSVQDAAAQHAATLLNPQNHEHILDACAAPGGKTGHILELAPQANIDALDHDRERLQRVEENLERLNCHARLIHADAANTEQWWNGELYDAILLDAPCSGSGILRRHPDIAFLRNKTDLQHLPQTQKQLLQKLWPLLKPGGRLLYTTCSILPQENQKVIQNFLRKNSTARLMPVNIPDAVDTGSGTLHLPDQNGDGFFYALLQKISAL